MHRCKHSFVPIPGELGNWDLIDCTFWFDNKYVLSSAKSGNSKPRVLIVTVPVNFRIFVEKVIIKTQIHNKPGSSLLKAVRIRAGLQSRFCIKWI